jgi:acetyltransferase
MKEVGVPVLPPHSYAFKIIKNILEYSQYNTGNRILKIAIPDRNVNRGMVLSENQSKTIIKDLGIPVPEEKIAENEEDAERIADEIGFPVVMKINSSEIMHKSDAGGVILNITNVKEVKESYRSILANIRNYSSDVTIKGVLVQKMQPKGLETIIGVKSDPIFGPMVIFGLGGFFVDIFEDFSLYPIPFGKAEAFDMINSLKLSDLFHGYRNHPELDTHALVAALVAVSDFAVKNKNRLVEMDINPLVVYEKGKGVMALDGLIIADGEPI